MTPNTANLIQVANRLSIPLPGKQIRVKFSAREILENLEILINRLSPHDIQAGANDFIEENGAERLLELSRELRMSAEIIFDVMHHNCNSQAEETLALACKY